MHRRTSGDPFGYRPSNALAVAGVIAAVSVILAGAVWVGTITDPESRVGHWTFTTNGTTWTRPARLNWPHPLYTPAAGK